MSKIDWIGLGVIGYFTIYYIAYAIQDCKDTPKEKAIAVGMFWPIYLAVYLLKTFVRSANILINDFLEGDL